MKKLTTKEEEIMQVLWRLKKAFVKEIIEELPEPKPHYNTVSTIVRLLVDKEYVAFKAFGNTHRYYPIISKENYTQKFMGDVMANFFDNSFKRMVTFFAEKEDLSPEELKKIINIIENKKS